MEKLSTSFVELREIGGAMRCLKAWVFAGLLLSGLSPAYAQDNVALVLVPGAGGTVPNDFLIRNRGRLGSAGFATAVALSPPQAAQAARRFSAQGRRVILIGMSKGGPMVARALALGAPAAGAVFVSSALMPGSTPRSVAQNLGSPRLLPRTLVVHNPDDGCFRTPPGNVEAFVRWSGGRARVAWVSGGGPAKNACGPKAAHGFLGNDAEAIGAIMAFAAGR